MKKFRYTKISSLFSEANVLRKTVRLVLQVKKTVFWQYHNNSWWSVLALSDHPWTEDIILHTFQNAFNFSDEEAETRSTIFTRAWKTNWKTRLHQMLRQLNCNTLRSKDICLAFTWQNSTQGLVTSKDKPYFYKLHARIFLSSTSRNVINLTVGTFGGIVEGSVFEKSMKSFPIRMTSGSFVGRPAPYVV